MINLKQAVGELSAGKDKMTRKDSEGGYASFDGNNQARQTRQPNAAKRFAGSAEEERLGGAARVQPRRT